MCGKPFADMTSIIKFKTILIAFFFLNPLLSSGSTVVIFIASNGMVISTDSKASWRIPSSMTVVQEIEEPKAVILKKRIVVANIGLGGLTTIHYHFLTWMQNLERNLPSDISVDDVVQTIKKESSATLTDFVSACLKNGTIKRKSPDEFCESLVQFVVAGYQNGMPLVYNVHFDIDWKDESLIGPTSDLQYPADPKGNDYGILTYGIRQAITDVFNRETYAYHQAVTLRPETMARFRKGEYPSLDDTVALSRVLIQVEKNTNPDEVGGPIRTIKIFPSGRAEEIPVKIFAATAKGSTTANKSKGKNQQ
jgi:hypothetical protein